MANKDKRRPVVTCQLEKELISRVDSMATKEKISRNVMLGRLFNDLMNRDPTPSISVEADLNKNIRLMSAVTFRTERDLVDSVDSFAEEEHLSRDFVVGSLFRTVLQEPINGGPIQKRPIIKGKPLIKNPCPYPKCGAMLEYGDDIVKFDCPACKKPIDVMDDDSLEVAKR